MSVYQSSSLALSVLLASCCAMIIPDCVTAQDTVYIVSASDSSPACPGDPCLTIDQYVSNSSLREGVLDVTLELQPGYHNLTVPFTIRSSVLSIAMVGNGSSDVTLLCTQEFSFHFIGAVRISGISLVNCGGLSTHIRSAENFTLEDSTFTSDMPFRLQFVARNFVISNSVFSNCTSGALLITDSRPMIANCTFSDNVKQRMPFVEGDTRGGVINFVSSSATIENCTFRNNRAVSTSGALYFTGGTSIIRNSYFVNNSAIDWDGGAVFSTAGSLIVEFSTFTNNVAGDNGGALYLVGQANMFSIGRCDFLNNTARFEGGAVSLSHENSDTRLLLQSSIHSSTFTGNSAGRQGGAVFKRGSNVVLSVVGCTFIDNMCSNYDFGSGALYVISGTSKIVVMLSTFIRNRGPDGALHVIGSSYSATVEDCSFTENVATVSGGALGSTSLDVGNFTIRDVQFERNSAPQCGAVDLKPHDMNPNLQTRNALIGQILGSTFTDNSASVGSGGALCISSISVSISGFTIFRRNSAVTGGGAISTTNSALTISGASFSDNSARSGGDAIHACSSEVTEESSDGLLDSSTDGQCLLFDDISAQQCDMNAAIACTNEIEDRLGSATTPAEEERAIIDSCQLTCATTYFPACIPVIDNGDFRDFLQECERVGFPIRSGGVSSTICSFVALLFSIFLAGVGTVLTN